MGKKPEMSQVYKSNEFIFSEKGGKGKNLSTFLKNLSLTSNTDYKEVNSNIYGSLNYQSDHQPPPNINRTNSKSKRSVSGPNSFLSGIAPTISHSPTRSKRIVSNNIKYADLDDDWDAELEDRKQGFGNNINNHNNGLPPSMFMDSFFPDLTIPLETNTNNINDPKESIDVEDMKTNLEITKLNQIAVKFEKFKKILIADQININELRKLSWNGIPINLRAICWMMLIGYLPVNRSRQASTLKIKRQEFIDGLSLTTIDFNDNDSKTVSNTKEKQLYHQIKIDVKRTNPNLKLYSYQQTQKSLRKILYFWSIRHPASGYVQGINDLVTPFYQLFLNNYLWQLQRKKVFNNTGKVEDDDSKLFIPNLLNDDDIQEQEIYNDPNLMNLNISNFDPARLSDRVNLILESDSYWCLSRLLDTITDNYIHEQPGILKQVQDLKNLVSKIDIDLVKHFDNEGIEFIQFSFRWMNCLLMRELNIELIIRIWDTYLSETPLGFTSFHVYVCASFLLKFSDDLKTMEFQDILLFLQNPPTAKWGDKDIELILSEGFIWQSLYKSGGAHLK